MTNRSKRLFLPLLALLCALPLLLAGPVAADELDDALRSGRVGETLRGYIAPVESPSAATTKLVNRINSQRREKYVEIAKKNNMSLQQIEVVVGKRIIERAANGTYYQDNSGQWQRK